jgi:hypothetical protein
MVTEMEESLFALDNYESQAFPSCVRLQLQAITPLVHLQQRPQFYYSHIDQCQMP